MKGKFSIGVAVLAVLAMATTAQAAVKVDRLPATPLTGDTLVEISELTDGNWDSRREANNRSGESYVCPDMPYTSGPCAVQTGEFQFYGSNLMPVCKVATETDCIDSLTFTDDQGAVVTAERIGYAGGPVFPAVPSMNLAEGSQVSLWRAPGFQNGAGLDTYAVIARARQDWNPGLGRFSTNSMDVAIVPYQVLLSDDYHAPKEFQTKFPDGTPSVGGMHPSGCAWSDEGKCGKRVDFVGTPKISLKLRASTDLVGWFRGRLSRTAIDIQPFSATNNLVTVTGQPVSVARFGVIANAQNTPADVQALFPAFSSNMFFSTDGWTGAPFTLINGYRNLAKDTSRSVQTLWSFESTRVLDSNGSDKCLNDTSKVVGIVTTNATAYDGVAPTFKDDQLTYRVAALHYLPDGKSLFEGTYDLAMRSDVARCLYGFSKAPISATISVVDDNGEAKTAVTVVNETDGWLKMAAYGFSFSNPTIKAKLTQAKPEPSATPSPAPSETATASPSPTATPAPIKPVAKTATITCVKGKLVKKVTGKAPKCPAGYKKKS